MVHATYSLLEGLLTQPGSNRTRSTRTDAFASEIDAAAAKTEGAAETAASPPNWRSALNRSASAAVVQAAVEETAATEASLPAAEISTAAAANSTTETSKTAEPGDPYDWKAMFGSEPFLANPVEKLWDGSLVNLNPIWFAKPETAQIVAGKLGGKVVEMNEFTGDSGIVSQQQPNQMVELPTGVRINAGAVAWLYMQPYPRPYIDNLIQQWIDPANQA